MYFFKIEFSCDLRSFCSSTSDLSLNFFSSVLLMALCFTTIKINKDYYLWKILLPFGFFSILWIDLRGLFSTWSSLSLWISLIGFDVFSKFSFVFSDFLTLFTRLCELCCVWQSSLTFSTQTGASLYLIKIFLFSIFIDENVKAWIVRKVDTPSDCIGLDQVMIFYHLFTTQRKLSANCYNTK